MTDIIITAPISIRRSGLPKLWLPTIARGASLDAIARLIGDALNLAYVDPYTSLRRQPRVTPDNELEGRDPDW